MCLGSGEPTSAFFSQATQTAGLYRFSPSGAGPVNLHDLSVVNSPADGLHNRQKVHFVAVSSQLDSIGQSARNLIKKCFGRFGVAIPNQPTQDQLAIGVDCYERPSVTSETARGNRGRDVLVLCSHEAP